MILITFKYHRQIVPSFAPPASIVGEQSVSLIIKSENLLCNTSTSLPPHTIRRIPLRIRLHHPVGKLRTDLSGYNFAYFNNQFVLVGILPVWSFVIVLAERSGCCLVEQMTTLVLPPPVPYRAMTGIALLDSANSVRFVWLNSFIPHHYRRIVCDSVLMISCDRGGYCTPPFPLVSNTNGGCPCSSCRSVPATSCVTYITAPP